MKYAKDIVEEMNKRGPVKIPDGCFADETFDEYMHDTIDTIEIKLPRKIRYKILEAGPKLLTEEEFELVFKEINKGKLIFKNIK